MTYKLAWENGIFGSKIILVPDEKGVFELQENMLVLQLKNINDIYHHEYPEQYPYAVLIDDNTSASK